MSSRGPVSELRIVAGEFRGRRIAVPKGAVRPTADKVRESWLNIVRADLDGARVADLCAGSGALGLEALSRGAVHCDFVEQVTVTGEQGRLRPDLVVRLPGGRFRPDSRTAPAAQPRRHTMAGFRNPHESRPRRFG